MASNIVNTSLFILVVICVTSLVARDVTNLEEFLTVLAQNKSAKYSIGYLTAANADVLKRYLDHNTERVMFNNRTQLLKAIDDGTIIGKSRRSTNDCTP